MSSCGKGKAVETRCAACQNLQRVCVPGCVFARYFAPGDERFAAVREAFDLDALARYLDDQDPDEWADVAQAIVDEAIRRVGKAARGGRAACWRRALRLEGRWFRGRHGGPLLPRDDSARFAGVHASLDATYVAWREAVLHALQRLAASARLIPERRLPQHWAVGVFGALLDQPAAADVPGTSTGVTAAFPEPAASFPHAAASAAGANSSRRRQGYRPPGFQLF